MNNKITFWTDDKGNLSWMRLVTFLYFVFIAIPGSWIILFKTMNVFIEQSFSWEQMIFSTSIFAIIQLGWVAPKHLSKIVESKGLIDKMLEKK